MENNNKGTERCTDRPADQYADKDENKCADIPADSYTATGKCTDKNPDIKIKECTISKASFTVEAACIMPVVLMVTFSCLYLCFYVHNRTFLTAAANEASVCGSIEACRENGEAAAAARERCIQLGNTGFFGAENLHCFIEAGDEPGSRIRVVYELDSVFRPFGIRWNMHTEGTAYAFCPSYEIRHAIGEGEE
ncbi:MAG: pilus assembly protein [Blautia sp.]|nr:pilus assembly protein [Blautia sp.]